MLVQAHAMRYGSDIPVIEKELNSLSELEAFNKNVLMNDNYYYVYKITCPEHSERFECFPPHFYDEFLSFAQAQLT